VERQDLLELAKAAVELAEGRTTLEKLPADTALRLGEVKLEIRQLNQGASTIAVRQFISALALFIEVAAEADAPIEMLAGQLAVQVPTRELEWLAALAQMALKVRREVRGDAQ
jgi:hypothetical protein